MCRPGARRCGARRAPARARRFNIARELIKEARERISLSRDRNGVREIATARYVGRAPKDATEASRVSPLIRYRSSPGRLIKALMRVARSNLSLGVRFQYIAAITKATVAYTI